MPSARALFSTTETRVAKNGSASESTTTPIALELPVRSEWAAALRT